MSPRTAVTAIDLETWASRRESQELLPVLLRKLVFATGPDLQRMGFPAYESVSRPGWDGIVVAGTGDPHVPAGASAWELGVNQDITTKANGDYNKRTATPQGIVPADSVFVFVTPRRWSTKDAWIAAKAAEGKWREVRAYDGVDLEQWLERAPGPLLWMAEHIGRRVDDAWDLGTHWRDWAGSTSPPLPPSLLLAGRTTSADSIRDWLASDRQSLTVAADSREEALAFFEAVVESMAPDERDRVQAKSLVIASDGAWQRMVRETHPLILIPATEGLASGAALGRGHRIVLPSDRAVRSGSSEVVQVDRLSRREAQVALKEVGVEEDRAQELAGLARRSLMALRRRLALPAGQFRPAWLYTADAIRLMPLLLLGMWNGANEGDRSAAATLAGLSYEDLDTLLQRLAATGDPPARQVEGVWRVVSREEMWDLLSPLLTARHVEQFLDVGRAALEQPASGVSSTLEERFLATMRGEKSAYSDTLRRALAEGLGFLGTRGAGVPSTSARSIADIAAEVVARALDAARDDVNRWASLAPLLSDLVEAAPDQVLRAIDADLRRPDPVLPRLFVDRDGDFFSSSPHTGLLWGLEHLAWSPAYLANATLQLARLARHDAGGRLTNRPANSLTDIFRSWLPATSATVEQRFAALDRIRENEPQVAWTLLASLLPKGHDHAMVKSLPKWREWAPEGQPRVTYGEIRKVLEGVIARILVDVGPPGPRWEPVIEALGHLPPDLVEQLVGHLEALPVEGITDAALTPARKSLRSLLSRHRSVIDKAHRLSDEVLDRLTRQLSRLQPRSLPERHAWLFSWWPEFPDGRGEDVHQHEEIRQSAQKAAARELYESGGLEYLFQCAALAEVPRMVGFASGTLGELGDELAWLGDALSAETAAIQDFAFGYASARFGGGGWQWAQAVLEGVRERWTPEQVGAFLLCLPPGHTAWEQLARTSPETQVSYWSRFRGFGLESPQDCDEAGRQLIAHGRPFAAIEVLGLYAKGDKHVPDPAIVVQALEGALGAEPPTDMPITNMLGYHVDLLLDSLTESGTIDDARLATLEWRWLPLFRFGKRTPSVLHRELRRNPGFFVLLVSLIYRAEGEEPRASDEQARRQAEIAYDLLQHWRSPITEDANTLHIGEWVATARQLLGEAGRTAVGDISIGLLLSGAPVGVDGAWPHEDVRVIIEAVGSADLEQGISDGAYNSRGVVSRDPAIGGSQERAIAERYERDAQSVASRWPRTAAMLRSMADSYRRDARREDLEADAMEES